MDMYLDFATACCPEAIARQNTEAIVRAVTIALGFCLFTVPSVRRYSTSLRSSGFVRAFYRHIQCQPGNASRGFYSFFLFWRKRR